MAMPVLSLSDGMIILEGAFGRATKILEGYPHAGCVYNLCTPKIGFENAQAIYARYDEVMKECIMLSKSGSLLKPLEFLPALLMLPLRSQVNNRYSNDFQSSVRALVNQQRDGEKVDCDLVKTILDFFVEAKSVGATCYDDFEKAILADAAAYYSQMASYGLSNCSYIHYVSQACMSMNRENERTSRFLDPSTRRKLLQVITLPELNCWIVYLGCDLVKTILDFFVEAKSVGATCYDDFEKAILADAAAYYSQMASYGLSNCSYIHYVSQACMSMNRENERTSRFLDPSTRRKLLQVARIELLDRVSGLILEKQRAENNITVNHHQEVPITHELENYLSELMARVDITP
ncbi:Cullin-like protein [Drosera capensis]